MCRDFFEEDLVDVDQELALELELFAVLEVVVFELLLLVGLGRATDLRVAVFLDRFLLFHLHRDHRLLYHYLYFNE